MPAYGNPFVTEGYLYPSGTLGGSNGVLPDGRPEFPAEGHRDLDLPGLHDRRRGAHGERALGHLDPDLHLRHRRTGPSP